MTAKKSPKKTLTKINLIRQKLHSIMDNNKQNMYVLQVWYYYTENKDIKIICFGVCFFFEWENDSKSMFFFRGMFKVCLVFKSMQIETVYWVC